MGIKELSHEESVKALREAVENASSLASSITSEELAANPNTETGACCLYTYGVASCTGGITQTACAKAASNTGTMYKFTTGRSCSQVSCP